MPNVNVKVSERDVERKRNLAVSICWEDIMRAGITYFEGLFAKKGTGDGQVKAVKHE